MDEVGEMRQCHELDVWLMGVRSTQEFLACSHLLEPVDM